MPRKKRTAEQQASLARLNAMRHGFARRLPIILNLENEADWERHLKGLRESFKPEGYFEELLVRRLATELWEVDRLTAFQVAATMHNISRTLDWSGVTRNMYREPEDFIEADPHDLEERMQRTLLPSTDDLELIMRYGGILHRKWIQIHNQLITAQARRRGEKVLPAMVDLMGPPPNLGPFPSAPHPAAQLAQAVDARLDQHERRPAAPKRAARKRGSKVPDYLAKHE